MCNYEVLTEILKTLKSQNSISLLKIIQIIIPIIAVFLSTFLGYNISRLHESRRYKRDVHFNMLKCINQYVFQINKITTYIVNIQKLGRVMLGPLYQPFEYDESASLYDIILKVRTLESYINSGRGIQTIKNTQTVKYKDDLLQMMQNIQDFNLFIDSGRELEKDAVNYLLLVDKKIKTEYEIIRDSITQATMSNLKDLYIFKHNEKVVNYIYELNKVIKKYS